MTTQSEFAFEPPRTVRVITVVEFEGGLYRVYDSADQQDGQPGAIYPWRNVAGEALSDVEAALAPEPAEQPAQQPRKRAKRRTRADLRAELLDLAGDFTVVEAAKKLRYANLTTLGTLADQAAAEGRLVKLDEQRDGQPVFRRAEEGEA